MAFMFSELRRLTYQSDSRTVVVSELNIRQENKMAPQQRDGLSKGSDFEVETMQNLSPNRQQSDLGTSIESSLSPAENGLERQAIAKIEEPSSDDSGSVQITQVNQESESPLMKLQSALKENGRLGEKLHAPNSLTCKTENNFIVSASSPHDRDLPSTSSGIYHMNSPPETYRRNLSPTTTAIYQGSLPISSTNINYSPSSNINGNGNLPPNSSYSSFCTNVSAGPYYRTDYSMASKEVRNGNVPSPSSAYNAISAFSCRVCGFTCVLKEEYDMHMNEHYVHKCPHCNYTSRTEGRLKRHVKEFHSDTPPESWAGTRSSKKDAMNSESIDSCVTSSNGKSRSFKCKQCDFVAYQKAEFWKHTKIHIKPEKLLQCPHCEFVTEFKHHYEYHIMNHFGRKPFKCPYCNYKCVNKSMLNSHLKSHSSVYQFHCADCKYETKYCHSIKQHLKKQNHRPGIVFGQDGTPCPNIIIDVYGKRRGPRAKKRKLLDMPDNNCDTTVPASNQIPATVPSNQGLAFPTAVPLVQQNIPILNSNFLNFQRDLLRRYNPEITNCNFSLPTNSNKRNQNCFRCALCPFVTEDQEMFSKHSFWHMAKENADIAKVYGINLELMRGQEMAINGDANGQNNCPENEHRRSVPSNDNVYESHSCKQEYEESIGDIKHEEERRSPKYRRISVTGNDDENDSLKGFSPPSPPGSSNYSSDIGIYMDKTSADRSSPDFVPEVNRMEDNESPIDLSGRKSSDSIKTNKSSEDLGDPSQSTNQITSICTPRSELSSASQRNRRKGKAYKINHYMQYDNQSPLAEEKETCNNKDLNLLQKGEITPEQNTDQKTSSEILNGHANVSKPKESVDTSECTLTEANEGTTEPTVMVSKQNEKDQLADDYSKWYECVHCEMLFKSLTMYTMHKGYHALKNPFCCNFCGHISRDKVEFYIHTTSVQH